MDNKLIVIGGIVLIGLVVLGAVGVYALLVLFPSQCVAVIKIDGPLTTQGSSGDLFSGRTMGSEELSALIREADSRDDVSAIVLEINSPGGSVVASREIYETVKNSKKPKVSYFREVAASGGYYVAAGSDHIVSNPDAITGSIGVVATYQEMSGLFDLIGINTTTFTSGKHKDMGNPTREITDEEKAIVEAIIEEIFDEFKGVVLENRGDKLDRELFDVALDGRILTGRQAYRTGLVDELGNKQDALDRAAGMAGMDRNPDVCNIEVERNLLFEMFYGFGNGLGNAMTSAKGFATNGWSFGLN